MKYVKILESNREFYLASEWEKIQRLLNKMDTLEGIKKGYIEVKKAKNSKKKLRTLNEFLSEC
jgi:hypothetical protein